MGNIFKNKALSYRVRRGSRAGKGILFYLLIGMLLIAFMDSQCLDLCSVNSVQCSENYCFEKAKALVIVKGIYIGACGKLKMILLLAFFWFCGCLYQSAESRRQIVAEELFIILEGTHKSSANTTDLTSQLLKTVNVNVLESKHERIFSFEKENVLKGGGEGWFF